MGDFDDRDRIDQKVLNKLNNLLRTSLRTNKYYSRKIKPEMLPINDLSDFNIIPPIKKQDIRENYNELISDFKIDFIHGKTSGSSGDPIKYLVDKKAFSYARAGYYRMLNWYGVGAYDRTLLIWGTKAFRNETSIVKRIVDYVFGIQYKINVFELNEANIEKYYNDLITFKPRILRAYTSAAVLFFSICEKKGLPVDRLGIKLIVVTSEVLLEMDRKFLVSRSNAFVVNEYGCSETGPIAYDCPAGKLHIIEENIYIETNAHNEVLVTNLNNFLFPFIRYELGDIVLFDEIGCDCGRKTRTIKNIEGRTNEAVETPDGRILSQYIFYYLMNELMDKYDCTIEKFRVTQKKFLFFFEVITDYHDKDELREFINFRTKNQIGPNISVEVNFVKMITRDISGKLRFFCKVKPDE